MPSSTISRASRISRVSRASAEGGRSSRRQGGKARSVKSQGSLGLSYAHVKIQEELREANLAADRARSENARKNRNFVLVKREMENRRRAKEKEILQEAVTNEEYYVDRDRAAAVTLGSRDIRSDVKGRKDFLAMQADGVGDEDDSWILTYIKQGQYELKNGSADKALMYFNKAEEGLSKYYKDASLYVMRSECHCKLGNYDEANRDAQTALDLDAYDVKGLVAKAEAQYNLGNFEHSLKFFWRALWERPGYYNIRQGMIKARSAIENSLSTSLNFLEMEDIIKAIIQDPDVDLGYEYVPPLDDGKFELDEEEKKALFDTIEEVPEEDSSEEEQKKKKFVNPFKVEWRPRRRSSVIMDVMDGDSILVKLLGGGQHRDTEEVIAETFEDKIRRAREKVKAQKELEKKKYNKQEIRMAERNLLGVLYSDQKYLKRLIKNPILRSKFYPEVDSISHDTQEKIRETAQEGLAFLERRKTFWQQQEPVFARKFRTAKGNIVTLV